MPTGKFLYYTRQILLNRRYYGSTKISAPKTAEKETQKYMGYMVGNHTHTHTHTERERERERAVNE